MKIRLLYPQGKESSEFKALQADFIKKISRVLTVSHEAIKTKGVGRDESDAKKKFESDALIKSLDSGEFVVLLDEHGMTLKTSKAFAQELRKWVETHPGRVTFVVGGPYGVGDAVKARANIKMRLSDLTMNHHLAQLVLLEQIYRATTIWSNKPYHNE